MKKLLYNHKVVSTAFTSLCLAAMATSCSQELEESKVQTDNNPADEIDAEGTSEDNISDDESTWPSLD